jgi:putative glycosyltransferase (TIGR04372 family)
MVPLAESGRTNHDLFILKKYWHSIEERYMTFHEMVLRGADWNRLWHDKQKAIADEGIEIIDNTSEEILSLTKEMFTRLQDTWIDVPDDNRLQDRFRNVFPQNHPMRFFPGYIGSEFLRQNEELLVMNYD